MCRCYVDFRTVAAQLAALYLLKSFQTFIFLSLNRGSQDMSGFSPDGQQNSITEVLPKGGFHLVIIPSKWSFIDLRDEVSNIEARLPRFIPDLVDPTGSRVKHTQLNTQMNEYIIAVHQDNTNTLQLTSLQSF